MRPRFIINCAFLTSKERDTETGLDYFLARYYSSSLGRFVNPDEFTGGPDELFDFVDVAAENPTFYADLTNPQSLNKFQYAYNNPLRYIDPDGHEPELSGGDDCTTEKAAGAAKGAAIGAAVGTVVGGLVGGGGGTLVAPGVGTVGGGYAGVTTGAAMGAGAGAIIGGAIGAGITPCTQKTPTLGLPPSTTQSQPQTGTPPNTSAQPKPPPPQLKLNILKTSRKKIRINIQVQGLEDKIQRIEQAQIGDLELNLMIGLKVYRLLNQI